jgi:hypothetical protein
MRKMLSVAGLAAALGFAVVAPIGLADAGAVPADAAMVKQSAAAASPLLQAQFAGRRTRHGVVKCYRTLVVGPYRCHHFYRPFSTW